MERDDPRGVLEGELRVSREYDIYQNDSVLLDQSRTNKKTPKLHIRALFA
jgi:hypothetical protein